MKRIWILVLLAGMLAACAPSGDNASTEVESASPGMGMGPGGGMMERHRSSVPADFAGLTNPIVADDESLTRGEEIFTTQCATCHGDGGMGDGPGGAALDPAPAAIAHTSQMMSDAYLFWRITEGGIPFETSMIPYRDILDEQARWDVINYIRALGSGQVMPQGKMGGNAFDPELEAAQRAEMLSTAVEQGVITQKEADNFDFVHGEVDVYTSTQGIAGMGSSDRPDVLDAILSELVNSDVLAQDQADSFMDVHDRLMDAGLMQ